MRPIVKGRALKAYFNEHVKPVPNQPDFYEVVEPLRVFKRVVLRPSHFYAIANLSIPVGARIYAHPEGFVVKGAMSYRKMRASEASVHSIIKQFDGSELQEACALRNIRFKYRPGAVVIPTKGFDATPRTCASGIHFFLNLGDALEYHL